MKKKPIAIAAILVSANLLCGQAYDSSTGGGGGAPNFFGGGGGNGGNANGSGGGAENQNNVMNVGSGQGLFESQTGQNMADSVFNTDSDSINFEDGTFNWKGRTFNLGNARVARARFERYLASPDLTSNDEVYIGIIERIASLLSLVGEDQIKDTKTLQDEIFQAWEMLFKASRYEMDQGISLVVANQVYNIWRIRDENYALSRARSLMEERKDTTEGDLLSHEKLASEHMDRRERLKAEGRHTGAAYDGVTQSSLLAQELVSMEARIAAMDATSLASGQMAKLQFQSQLVNLLLSRRFEHCQIAAQFYRFAFKGSHQTITVGGEELASFVPVSDFTPTVETVELLAREAKADVRTGMDTVNSLYDSNELFGALERMQETFFLGEFTPEVLEFPAEKKRKLLELYRKTRELQVLLDNKDYSGIERVVEECQAIAYDFPASSVLSGITSVKSVSNMAVMDARRAVAMGEFDKAESRLEQATALWPQNPAIKTYMEEINQKLDIGNQAGIMFDDLFKRNDYRAIYEESAKFSAALIDDEARREQLKQAVEKISRVDILIAGATEMDTQGNAFQAWEMLAEAESIYADDYVLARAQAKLAPRVANFVGALDRAEQAEKDGNFALSLTRYLQAKEIYPASKIGRQGIERLSEKVMDSIQPPAQQNADS